MANKAPSGESMQQWHLRQVRSYARLLPRLRGATQQLAALLRAIAAQTAPDAGVHVRTKSLLSMSEKIVRGGRWQRHPEPLDLEVGLSDLIGGQIVTYTQRDADAVCAFLERLGREHRDRGPARRSGLEIDDASSVDTATRLQPSEFGYTARHYIVRLHGRELLGVDVSKISATGRRMEIQVSHALAYAWNAVTHDRTYKADLTLPDHLKRRVAEAKAMLDAAARQMEEAVVDLDRYRRKHAGRLRAGEALQGKGGEDSEFWLAKLVCDSVLAVVEASDSTRLDALRARAELAIAEEDWKTAIPKLRAAAAIAKQPTFAVRLAEVLRHTKRATSARKLLVQVLAADAANAAAACALANLGFVGGGDRREAVQVMEAAFAASPREPEVLLTYVTARLLRDGDALGCCALRGALFDAIAECRRRHDLGSDVPACLVQQARLLVLAGDSFQAVETYCLAFLNQWHDERLASERHVLGLLFERVRAVPKEPHVQALRVGLECAIDLLDLLVKRRQRDRGASPTKARRRSFFKRQPIVIVAGGCDARDAAHIARYAATLERAFARFRGTILSGGTTAGISGLVGKIATQTKDKATGQRCITAVGYLPSRSRVEASGDTIDRVGYQHIVHVPAKVRGEPTYSPLGPIHTWLDLLAAGIDPAHVRVVGINGGKVSAFEFRLALAMGATIGLIEDSGRAVASLLTDPSWKDWRGVARLFNDAETIELFVHAFSAPMSGVRPLDAKAGLALGEQFHAHYCRDNQGKPGYVHESMLPWRGKVALDRVYRDSNVQQVRGLSWILATEGFAIVPNSDPQPAIELGRDEPITDGKTRREPVPRWAARVWRMARLEHARWNAERLALGWRQGPQRSLAKKTNPSIVPFDDLSEDVQRYDLMPFLNLAGELARLGPAAGAGGLKLVDLRAKSHRVDRAHHA